MTYENGSANRTVTFAHSPRGSSISWFVGTMCECLYFGTVRKSIDNSLPFDSMSMEGPLPPPPFFSSQSSSLCPVLLSLDFFLSSRRVRKNKFSSRKQNRDLPNDQTLTLEGDEEKRDADSAGTKQKKAPCPN